MLPGRKRPSPNKAAAELEDRDADADPGCGECDGAAGTKSNVAISSLFCIGVTHDEQKRPALAISIPQAVQVDMNFPIQSTVSERKCRFVEYESATPQQACQVVRLPAFGQSGN